MTYRRTLSGGEERWSTPAKIRPKLTVCPQVSFAHPRHTVNIGPWAGDHAKVELQHVSL